MNQMSNFCCAKCAKILPIGYQLGQPTGYVKHEQERICYNCWAKFEIIWMCESGEATLYLTEPWKNRWPGYKTACDFRVEVVNFAQTLRFVSDDVKRSVYPLRGRKIYRIDVWFTGPYGDRWHGVNRGDNQILRCKRLKRQRKHLTPLPESQYLKQYNYSR